ncbi:MAG: hypothetical protein A2W31_10555 [Planctomycetes bacterium RBG_16_64_10]|nr:MAG: hypothetical protein A2W31_10555 [Planctomycetes bacterium RBG_16_64_10]
MAKKTWTLTDVENDVYVEDLSILPSHVGGSATDYSVRKRTLRGGLRDGVDVVEGVAGACRLTLIPTRGMGIWRAWVGDVPIGWQSPIRGPVHPRYVPLADPGGLGWLDGFDELLVRCGLESNGAPDFDTAGRLRYPLHGRIANRPAHKLDVTVDGDTGEIAVTGHVDESRFHFQKLRLTSTVTVRPGAPMVRVDDQVTNLSGDPAAMQLLYHVNFGAPVLDAGARLILPAKSIAPRDLVAAEHMDHWDQYAPPQPKFTEQVSFFELLADRNGMTRTVLRNAAGTLGISLVFSTKELPCFTQWKNTPAAADGYVTGLEPGTNFPNARSFEASQGRVVPLAPGQAATFHLQLEVHTDAPQVAAAEQAVAQLQAGKKAVVLDRPQRGWSPDA